MNKQKKPLYWYYFIVLIILLLLDFVFIPMYTNSRIEETSYSSFLNQIEEKKVDEVQIENTDIYYTLKNDDNDKTYQTGVMNDPDLVNRLQDANVEFTQVYTEATNPLLYWFATFAIFAFFIWLGNRMFKRAQKAGGNDSMSFNQGGFGLGNLGKSNAKVYVGQQTGKTFKDVAGQEEAKNSLKEIVDFLNDPKKYQAIGAKMPKGALLVGPPGTGKTLLAKAVAGEAGVPFFSISGSDFVEMFVGVGASRVRDLFDQAKKAAPSIIFIDEIDAVGRQRGAGMGGGHDEREQTLNQLLVEMDGFTGNEGVIVIAATNRSDVLDPALLRPGRFDRKILVGRPDVKGREAILKVHAKNKPLAPNVDLKEIARQTPGFVGADLENLLNEAALVAARRSKKQIDAADVDEAEDRVIAGPAKKDRVISPKERTMVAYHEAGHAIVGLVLSDSRTVRKVTIIPRGRAGGYAIMLPKDDQFLLTKKELTEQIVGLLGGRTAEEIIFGVESTGASNDFEQATQIARSMVTQYGMSDRLGTVQLETEGQPFLGAQYGQTPPYSETTATAIDDEVRRIIDEAHKQAYEIIQAHRDQHKLIAEALLKYETLNEKEILSLFNDGKMPERDQDEFPSEKAATFEQSKAALEHKDKEKQADEEAHAKSEGQSNADQTDQDAHDDNTTDSVEKPDDTTPGSNPSDDDHQNPQA